MTQVLAMVNDLWINVGPGLALAVAFPLLFIAFFMVMVAGLQQVRDRSRR